MPWENRNLSMEAFLKKWIKIRRKFPALQEGSYETAVVEEKNGIYGFYRSTKGQRLLVIINTGTGPQSITLPEKFETYLDIETGIKCEKKEIIIPEGTGKVFEAI